jgi:hypothetical protein
MFNAKTQDGFLSLETTTKLVDVLSTTDGWGRSDHEFWDNRVINTPEINRLFGPEIDALVFDATMKVKDFITKEYNLEEDIIPDIVSLCRWFPGMEQPPHADDMTNSDVKGFEHRVFGAIIYLNDNYEGGKTFYPGHGIEITPKAGLLAVHPGDPEHLHGVTKIEGTVRYTIASFWTYDTTKSYVLSAH